MTKLIFLSGKSGCGKTSTLKLLSKMLIEAGAQDRIPVTSKSTKSTKASSSGDVTYFFSLHGVLIGIRTAGDTIGTVWDVVASFEKHPCDIGVLACHPEHLIRSHPSLTAPWKQHIFLCKDKALPPNTKDDENEQMAKRLFDEILRTVKEINPAASITIPPNTVSP